MDGHDQPCGHGEERNVHDRVAQLDHQRQQRMVVGLEDAVDEKHPHHGQHGSTDGRGVDEAGPVAAGHDMADLLREAHDHQGVHTEVERVRSTGEGKRVAQTFLQGVVDDVGDQERRKSGGEPVPRFGNLGLVDTHADQQKNKRDQTRRKRIVRTRPQGSAVVFLQVVRLDQRRNQSQISHGYWFVEAGNLDWSNQRIGTRQTVEQVDGSKNLTWLRQGGQPSGQVHDVADVVVAFEENDVTRGDPGVNRQLRALGGQHPFDPKDGADKRRRFEANQHRPVAQPLGHPHTRCRTDRTKDRPEERKLFDRTIVPVGCAEGRETRKVDETERPADSMTPQWSVEVQIQSHRRAPYWSRVS